MVENAEATATSHGSGFESEIEQCQGASFDSRFTQMVELGLCDVRSASGLRPLAQSMTSTMALFKTVNWCRQWSSGEGGTCPLAGKKMPGRHTRLSAIENGLMALQILTNGGKMSSHSFVGRLVFVMVGSR